MKNSKALFKCKDFVVSLCYKNLHCTGYWDFTIYPLVQYKFNDAEDFFDRFDDILPKMQALAEQFGLNTEDFMFHYSNSQSVNEFEQMRGFQDLKKAELATLKKKLSFYTFFGGSAVETCPDPIYYQNTLFRYNKQNIDFVAQL